MAKHKREQRSKRSPEHQRRVDDLRRSNAAGFHRGNKYSRREKYKSDYRNED